MDYKKGYVYELMDAGGPTDVREPYFEGTFQDGAYIRGRMLNGDERFSLLQTEVPAVQRVKWFCY